MILHVRLWYLWSRWDRPKMLIIYYMKDPPDRVKLKETESNQWFPSGEKRLRVKGKQHNPSDFLSVFVCPCWLLLTVEIKAFCMNTQETIFPRNTEPVLPSRILLEHWSSLTWIDWGLLGSLGQNILSSVSGLSLYLAFSICSFIIHIINAWMMSIHLKNQTELTRDFFSHYCSCKHDKRIWPVCLKVNTHMMQNFKEQYLL